VDPFTALAFEELDRPPTNQAKDFLGLTVTVAIVAAIVLYITNSLAGRCRAGPSPRARPGRCAGLSAVASHAAGVVTVGAAACAALFVAAFIWYMFWGYRSPGRPAGATEPPRLDLPR
jgi:hypothetical protein